MIKKFLLLSTMCSSSFFVNAQLVIPDITFDGDGKVTSNWLSGGNNTISKLLLQADGKIIGVGTYKAPSGQFSKFVSLTRYNTNGSIDATYGTAGFVTPNPTSGNDMIDDAVLQPDGKAVVAGTGHDSLLLMRFNTDGTIDNTFDGDGIVQYGNGTDRKSTRLNSSHRT